MKVLSLFSNIGVGEAYFNELGISVKVANEIVKRRANLYSEIYPEVDMIIGDIEDEKIFNKVIKKSKYYNIDTILATPPCQGMSTVGTQTKFDERNGLIKRVVDIVKILKPKYVFIENVPNLFKTKILINGTPILIPDYIEEELNDEYNIVKRKISMSDYDVPQKRERAIFLLTNRSEDYVWNFPDKNGQKVTLRDVIGHLELLDPYVRDITDAEREILFPKFEERRKAAELISKWHIPPVHVYRQVAVMQRTPTGKSAFHNEIYKPRKENGDLVKGFKNTYKRQDWDQPAYTITMDNRKISSQDNVHPGRKYIEDNIVKYSDPRALTLYELMKVMTIPDSWDLPHNASEAFVRSVIGEGIPPLFIKKVFDVLCDREIA